MMHHSVGQHLPGSQLAFVIMLHSNEQTTCFIQDESMAFLKMHNGKIDNENSTFMQLMADIQMNTTCRSNQKGTKDNASMPSVRCHVHLENKALELRFLRRRMCSNVAPLTQHAVPSSFVTADRITRATTVPHYPSKPEAEC